MPVRRTETAFGPVDGYVATRSATGTKTDTPLIETPQSISVVPRDQIDAQAAQSAKEALRYSAGVQAESRANFGGFDITYGRGFILNQYLDGMRLQGANAFITPQPEIYGLERIELLRGPASVLFGQGSPGGLINYVSKRPSDVPFNEMLIQGGSYDRIQGGFDSTGKLDPNGEFLYRITGFAKDADNQVNFVRDQRYYIAPSLTWRPTKDTTWTILTNYQRDPALGYFNFVPYRGSVIANPNGMVPTNFYAGDPNLNRLDRTSYSVTSLFEHRFSEFFTLRQNARYINTSGNFNQVLPFSSSGLAPDGRTFGRFTNAAFDSVSAGTTDTQGEFNFATGWLQHKLLIGLDTQNTLLKERAAFGGAPDIDVFAPAYGQAIVNPFDDPLNSEITGTRQSARQVGVYAQDQIKIGRLSIVGGARYDSAKSSTFATDNFLGDTATNQNDHATTGRIGAVYVFDSGVAPFVTYATSFDPAIGATRQGTPFRPITGTLYEAGVKYQPDGSKTFVQFSFFDLTQQNALTLDPVDPNFRRQTGEIHSRGFEIEAKTSINRNLDAIASYTIVDPKVTKSNDTDLGKVPDYIPRTIAAGWLDYTIREGGLNGLGFAMGVRYVGQSFADLPNLVSVPQYTLVDAAIHYELENLDRRLKGTTLRINATNLFDKTYVSQCTTGGSGSDLDSTRCVYGLRRQVLATLRYRW